MLYTQEFEYRWSYGRKEKKKNLTILLLFTLHFTLYLRREVQRASVDSITITENGKCLSIAS